MTLNYVTKSSFLTILTALLFTTFSLQAQTYNYSDNWGKAGYTLENLSRSNVTISYSIEEISLEVNKVNGMDMQNIILPGNILPNDEGAPDLPGTSRFVAIPNGSKAVLNVLEYRKETFQNIEMAPAPRIPLDTDKGPLHYEKNAKIYTEDAFYPANPFRISEITEIRGVNAVIFGITPFQYNPVTKELIVYRDVKVEIIFEGGTGEFGTDRLRSRWFDPILQDALINYASLPVIDYNKRLHGNMNGRDDVGYEYLIVIPTNPEYAQWADTIKAFRQKQGIITGIVTLTEIGGNTPTILENYFNNAYNTWDIPPVAVLLMADYGTSTANSITSPIWDNYCASDNIFADVTNNDMPDIIFARMTAQNATHLETMVTKFTNYEMDPPTSQDFYDKPITALGWQTERWFQLCSETVGGFWRSQGRDPVRVNAVYQGSPGSIWSSATNTSTVVNYFGPNGLGYIPATPAELGGWTGGTATMVNNAINSGSFMLQHRDHGYEQGWGEPSYSSSNISSLTNNSDNELVYVFSVNCLTGKYNMGGECFAEKFHRYKYNGENAGCLGILAASEVSYSFVNDVYVWGMYDNMWPEFMPEYGMPVEERGILPAFGNAAGKYFLQQSSWPYNTNNKEVTYNLFHHHGDAFTTVYSEVPMDLTVNNNPVLYSGETTYSVTADVGSFIALTVNGEIIGTAEGTGFPVIIDIEAQLPPNMMLVTVTKQNYYRYETNVEIIPPSGPYVVFEACVLDDFAGGNGNGMMDFSEDILFDVTLKNVGVEVAANVEATLSTGNEYITITNAVADFGNIDPNASLTLNGAFEIEVADNIPDDLTVSFEVSASDGTDSWVSSFTLKSHAPNLEVGSISVSDPSGNNNGNLDPGETADIMFETSNTGSSIAFMVMTNLASSSPFITLNSTSYDLENLEIGESKQATFNVTVSPAAPIGSTADFIYEVVCGGYEVEAMIGIKIGLIIEDFETGDFSGYEWEFAGNANWTISSGAYEGTYCAKSGTIGDQQTSQLLIELEVMNDDSISFFYKVSSEATYDFLQFFIDGAMKDEWSGNAGWLRAAYPVTEGTHTFKWIYDKDYSESNGSDCGWIDYITFPAMVDESLMAYAGPDSEICEDLNFTPSASANNYNSLLWETSGTGTFSDNTILDPVYTPSGDDYSSGSVTLTLTAYGTGEDISDDLLLSFMPMPEQCATPVGTTELCVNAPETTYSTTGAANATDYMWELVPENAGTLDYDGMTATVSWTEDYFGDVQLMVKGMNGCGEGDMSETLDISIIPAPGIAAEPTGDNTICEGTASTIYETTGAEWADGYVWTLTPAEAGTLTENGMSVEVTWATGWMGNAEINVAGVNNCGEGEISNAYPMNLITVPEAPDTPSGLTDLCADTEMTTYTISGVTYAEEYIWTITPEEAGTIAGNGTTADVTWATGWTGDAEVMVKAMNMCGEGDVSAPIAINIIDLPIAPAMPTGETDLCSNNGNTTYETTGATFATEYVWEISPVEAGTITGAAMTAEVDWAENWAGEAEIMVMAMNTCGESDYSDHTMVTLAPQPEPADAIAGKETACQGVEEMYNVPEIGNASSCEWVIEPSDAGTLADNGMECTITFSNSYEGDATLKVRGINDCGEGDWSQLFTVTVEDCTGIGENDNQHLSIYPNPNNGAFTVVFNSSETVGIKLINSIGKVVFMENDIKVSGTINYQVNTTNLSQGIYYLSISGETIQKTEKVVIRN